MTIQESSLASVVGVAVKNKPFGVSVQDLKRKISVIGTYDVAKISIADDIPARFLSAQAVGATYGFGSMLHRLAVNAFTGLNGAGDIFIVPQPEAGGAVNAAGQVAFTAAGAKAGTIYLYIANIRIPFTISDGATDEDISNAAVAAITANQDLPVTSTQTAVTFELEIDSKSAGPWGDDISIAFNLGVGEEFPTGVSQVTTPMAGGVGTPDIQDALDGMGVGDNANEEHFTGLVHGYGLETGTLNAISNYVGPGNDFTGLYSKTIARPFRALTGNVDPLEAGLTALIAIADTRLDDRANGVIYTPDSKTHPSEIAALAMGIIENVNSSIAASGYNGKKLVGVSPGQSINRPSDLYPNRDLAVKSGLSATLVEAGVVLLENVITFYRPVEVQPNNNGFRDMSKISRNQNILASEKLNFSQEKWQGVFIVEDASVVTGVNKKKARDIVAIRNDMFALADAYAEKGWIFNAKFMKEQLKLPGAIVIRVAGNGWDVTNGYLLSGNGDIIDIENNFDIAIS